jgi:hypothetical protein
VGLYNFAGVVCLRGATLFSKWLRSHNSGLVQFCWGRLFERCNTFVSTWLRNYNSVLVQICWGRLFERCNTFVNMATQLQQCACTNLLGSFVREVQHFCQNGYGTTTMLRNRHLATCTWVVSSNTGRLFERCNTFLKMATQPQQWACTILLGSFV